MNLTRRHSIGVASGLGLHAALAALGLLPAAQAVTPQSPAAFQARTVAETLKALGVASPADSKDLAIVAAELSDNGAVVDVALRSTLPRTELMALLVERNPNPLVCVYRIPEGTEPDIAMTVKISESSDVILVAKADGKYLMTRRNLKVTLGGCG
jgi:sulfur-oxidizing protein SoxY